MSVGTEVRGLALELLLKGQVWRVARMSTENVPKFDSPSRDLACPSGHYFGHYLHFEHLGTSPILKSTIPGLIRHYLLGKGRKQNECEGNTRSQRSLQLTGDCTHMTDLAAAGGWLTVCRLFNFWMLSQGSKVVFPLLKVLNSKVGACHNSKKDTVRGCLVARFMQRDAIIRRTNWPWPWWHEKHRLKYTGRWQRDGGSGKNKIRAAVIDGGNNDNDGAT